MNWLMPIAASVSEGSLMLITGRFQTTELQAQFSITGEYNVTLYHEIKALLSQKVFF